jgi:AraC-like DNA-binding protein
MLFCPLPERITFHIAKERHGSPKGFFNTRIDVAVPRLAMLLDEAVELSEHGGDFAEAGINALVLAHLVLWHKALKGWEPPPQSEPLKVMQTRLLIERGLQNQEISVASLADELNCTPGHLSQLFRQSTGTPLLAYLNEQRHQRALHLLTHTALQIAEVSTACGFSDPNYFTRAFSRREGVTPREWRKQTTAALNIGQSPRL